MMDGTQPFAAYVLEALAHREVELGRKWAERAGLAGPIKTKSGTPSDNGGAPSDAAEEVVRTVLAVARDEARSVDSASGVGRALGAVAHRRSVPLRQMLEELDRLEMVLLQAAERAAAEYARAGDVHVPGHAGLAVAQRICRGVSSLRLAAVRGYTRGIEEGLRERYRSIRHDLRNPLGTIRNAIALLTDETLPTEMRQSSRVRAMVVRNARSLDLMIAEALGDEAASLPALGGADGSARKQRDDLRRARQGPDLESGAL